MKITHDIDCVWFTFKQAEVCCFPTGEGFTTNKETAIPFPFVPVNQHLTEPTFSINPRFGYSETMPHWKWARSIHEVLHCWIADYFFKGESILIQDTPQSFNHRRPYYVAEEILVAGIEIEYNSQFNPDLDNSFFLTFCSWSSIDPVELLAEGQKIIKTVLATLK